MVLFEAFLVIAIVLIAIIALLWLISWLTRSKKNELDLEVKTTESEVIRKPVKEASMVSPQPKRSAQQSSPVQDDLMKIEGIGPEISEILNKSGIFTYSQLAATQVIILESILKDANLQIANPGTWPEQAALAAEGNLDALQSLQDEHQT